MVALPAAAPGCLAEAVPAGSPGSQLGGRGTVSWLCGTALSRDIRQPSPPGGTVGVGVRDGAACCGTVRPVLPSEGPCLRASLWRQPWKSKCPQAVLPLG